MAIKECNISPEILASSRPKGFVQNYADTTLNEFIEADWPACEVEIPEGFKAQRIQVALKRAIDSRELADKYRARQTDGKVYLLKLA